VLGLGGWFLGVLIAVTTMPGVPLDHEVLATLAVGLPIGLGLYYAWLIRESSASKKTVGIAAAVALALAGAWLGFHATVDLLALVTAIVGATVGGNVALLVLDIASDRRARERFVETGAETRPAPTAA
jgi:hypothetical protein